MFRVLLQIILCPLVHSQRAYVQSEVPFLLDESDTVLAYENSGRARPLGEDLLMSFLSSMDHVQQLEMIYRESWAPGRTQGLLIG